jgi:dTMP kinase
MKRKVMHSHKGKFIVLEGIDYCGKGTHARKLADHLFSKNKRFSILLTREPTMLTEEGRKIRNLLMSMKNTSEEKEALFQLYIEDRKKHLAQHVIPALEFGSIVISDRHKHSTIAYQGAQGVPIDKIIAAHEGMLTPDLTIIFDTSPEEYVRRAAFDSRKEPEVFDKDKEFISKVREIYLQMPTLLPEENIKIIDAARPFEEVHQEVIVEVEKVLLSASSA